MLSTPTECEFIGYNTSPVTLFAVHHYQLTIDWPTKKSELQMERRRMEKNRFHETEFE